MHKPFDYLWKADYMPPPDKMELRQEAIAQDLIGGVASDYQVQPSSSSSPSTSAVGVKSNRHATIIEYMKAYKPSD